ncbi:MAG: Bug family tripartite tricarboxylate transporter substrate binding protein [Alphaproteobacteria bacterium]
MNFGKSISLLAAISSLATVGSNATANEIANFYKDKQVSIVVAARAGGGHHKYSLFIARYLKKHTPGNPTYITQNMGGAGGTKAANYLYNRAAQDGSAIGILLSDTPFASRMRATGVKYVANKFHYLGGVDKPQGAFVVLKRSGIKTMEEAKKKSVVFASTGKGSQTYILPKLANAMIGTKFKIVTGYKGMAGVYKALDGKEADGFQSGWSSVQLIRPHWLAEGRVVVLAANSLSRLKDAPNAPTFRDLVKNPLDRKIVEIISNNDVIGRAWIAPPGIPKARLKTLRTAFKNMANDPDAIAAAKKRKMDWSYVPWQPQQAHASSITNADDKLFKRVRALINQK